ncbi:hypothetical protein QAD02_013191 [Eretmocerus hayati]|uniref:Uncharacterized protein n=1 Tax=Eretmocerus hayati TaxID=131215 RepID=A0ACC2P4E0_9HYME|nr:hypothetical protein QAD02_013191 [Eretmocerus hayati]
MQSFDRKYEEKMSLFNNEYTAVTSVSSDYSCSLVFSTEVLQNDDILCVKSDERWILVNISLDTLVITDTVVDFLFGYSPTLQVCFHDDMMWKHRHGSQIMTGPSIAHDGIPILEFHGTDLNTLKERALWAFVEPPK